MWHEAWGKGMGHGTWDMGLVYGQRHGMDIINYKGNQIAGLFLSVLYRIGKESNDDGIGPVLPKGL